MLSSLLFRLALSGSSTRTATQARESQPPVQPERVSLLMTLTEMCSARGLVPHLRPEYTCLNGGTTSLQGKPLRRVTECPETVRPVYSRLVTVVPPGKPHAAGCGHRDSITRTNRCPHPTCGGLKISFLVCVCVCPEEKEIQVVPVCSASSLCPPSSPSLFPPQGWMGVFRSK